MNLSILRRLKNLAKTGEGVGSNGNKLAACVVDKKGNVLATSTNSYKTHPLLRKFYEYPHLHAEAKAAISAGVHNCKNKEVVVVRVGTRDNLTMANPCPKCRSFLRFLGIKRVHYTDWSGSLQKEEL